MGAPKIQFDTRRSVNEMIGRRFHSLTVIAEVKPEGRQGRFYMCRCDCGGEAVVYGGHLRNGSTKGCGCARIGVNRTHGMSRTPEFRAWESAKARCYLPSNQRFKHYGARGIRMCEAWRSDFAAFLADMGPRPTARHSLDRRDNNNRDYEPSNCRWATPEEQNNNRSLNRFVIVDGRRVTVAQASRLTGIPHATILGRLNAGARSEDAAQ